MSSFNPLPPASSPQFLQLTMLRQWQILRPRVYRFLPKNYVEDFFADGSLRLSSFQRFAQHQDEQRNDASEGFGLRSGVGSEMSVFTVQGRGADCYVLCGSMHDTAATRECFPDCDGCIIIDNPTEFAAQVALQIPYFKGGYEGSCIYQDDASIQKSLGTTTPEELYGKFQNEDGTISMDLIPHVASRVGGIEEFFIKLGKYSPQSEYRFLWQSKGILDGHLDIKVPDAIQLCRKAVGR